MTGLTHLSLLDWSIVLIYFLFVLSIGLYIQTKTKSSDDFFLAGRRNSSWVAGIAFLSANMGALELLGMSGQTYQYGLLTAHFYLIGAIPAMLFLAIFMMPFYYSSRIHSIPGYLKLRFNPATQTLNAVAFAVMTLLMSGINMYAMALVMHVFIGWSYNTSIWVSSLTVLTYISLGGLTSAIFSEVLQFFLIWFGLALAVILGFIHVGSFSEIHARLPDTFLHLWRYTDNAQHNPMMLTWIGLVFGLGFVLSFGYWTTDFLVIQRAFSAKSIRAARMTPIIASFLKMTLPIIVVLSGLLVLVMVRSHQIPPLNKPDDALLYLIISQYPHGLIGLGVTALLAGFMSGQAGNVSAFNTVFTYDLYRGRLNANASDSHYLRVGRVVTVVGVLLSIVTAYWAMHMPSIMGYMQALFSMVNAPLFAVILLGMFCKRINGPGAFCGLTAGIGIATFMFLSTQWHLFPSGIFTPGHLSNPMTSNFWRAIWSWSTSAVVTVVVSLCTKAQNKEQLHGLIYELSAFKRPITPPVIRKPSTWALISLLVFFIINYLLW